MDNMVSIWMSLNHKTLHGIDLTKQEAILYNQLCVMVNQESRLHTLRVEKAIEEFENVRDSQSQGGTS